MPIQWTKELSLGIPDLDAQHLELDRQLALVHDPICEDRLPDISLVLEGVRSCSSRHFECEEAYMASSGYPSLEAHRALHRQFMGQLERFEEARAREGATMRLAMEIGSWLAGWVREHQRHDLQLATHIRKTDHPGTTAR
jgi:hemerythrin-like metal-binding protein